MCDSDVIKKQLHTLKNKTKAKAKSALTFAWVFIKWLIIASVTGLIGGAVGTVFNMSINFVTGVRISSSFPIVLFLPLGGMVIVGLYKLCRVPTLTDTNRILRSVRSDSTVTVFLAPLIFIGSVITHLFGGSAGREGAALQLGGSIGGAIGKLLRLDERDMHVITLCGMASVFSALFGTPITAAFFAMEVISIGIIYYSGLIPCLIAALTAYGVSSVAGLSPIKFTVKNIPELSPDSVIRVIILAVLCAIISIVFCVSMHKTAGFFKRTFRNEFIRAAVGGAIIVLFTFAVRSDDYNGLGTAVIEKAFNGRADSAAFLIKIIFTAVTIGAGFKGGEIIPTFFVGSTFGCMAGRFVGLDSGFSAAVGFCALFCGVVNCPVASIMLCLEVFGSSGIVLFAVAVAVSYMLSGYYGLYKGQKIIYSKLKNEYINIHAK